MKKILKKIIKILQAILIFQNKKNLMLNQEKLFHIKGEINHQLFLQMKTAKISKLKIQ